MLKMIEWIGIAVAAIAVCVMTSIHRIDQGYVGVYYRGGALLNEISSPGYQFQMPLLTSHSQVQTTIQTDSIRNIPCGTSGGVVIHFDRIEVVNQLSRDAVHRVVRDFTIDYDQALIFNKIHHELNQFCSSHTLQEVYIDLFDQIDENLQKALQDSLTEMAKGLKVLGVRVTKPKIPEAIRRSYENMEGEKTKLLIAVQKQKVIEKEAETQKRRAIIEAEKVAAVAKIKNEERVASKKSEQEIQSIGDEMALDRVKNDADAFHYKILKEAEANEKLLTELYVDLKKAEYMSKSTKFFFGPSIPKTFVGNSFAATVVAGADA